MPCSHAVCRSSRTCVASQTCRTNCQTTSKASGRITHLGAFQDCLFHDRETLQAACTPSRGFPKTWELQSGAHLEKVRSKVPFTLEGDSQSWPCICWGLFILTCRKGAFA